MEIDPSAIESLKALVLGFAFAGLIASTFELLTADRASFHLLNRGGAAALASVPMLVFGAPFIILRNTVRGRRFEKRPFHFVMIATIIACAWSLVAGRVVLDIVETLVG